MPYDPQGSRWRIWDLHCHTPSSHDYHDQSVANDLLVDSLINANVSVVAITDHNLIDLSRLRDIQRLAGHQLTVLPGIEFCSELGGTRPVHFIGLFGEEADIEYIWNDISVKLELTEKDIERRGGQQKIYTDIKEAAGLVHRHRGLISIHAGHKSNSIEEISGRYLFQLALKKDLLDGYVDILEIGRLTDIGDYESIVFPSIGRHLPLVMCSDNHSVRSYQLKSNCWLKCDAAFSGLRQALVEPSRVYIGDVPPKEKSVASRPTKYIRSVTINKKSTSALDEPWFDGASIALNPDLVAIIGNKGSGKSALAEVIGLLGNTHNDLRFSFLHQERFRIPRNNRSEHFEARLTWESGLEESSPLNRIVDPHVSERVKCIPQGLFEDVCNEIADDGDSSFNRELETVIFSHVGASDRLGRTSLRELIEYLTQETYGAIDILRQQLHDLNKVICGIEDRLSPEYRKRTEDLAAVRRGELEAHARAKPVEVPKPDEALSAEAAARSSRMQETRTQIEQVRTAIGKAHKEDEESASLVAACDRAAQLVANFQQQHLLFTQAWNQSASQHGIPVDQVVSVSINTSALDFLKKKSQARRKAAQEQLALDRADSLTKQLEAAQHALSLLQDEMDAPAREYEEYRRSLEDWSGREQMIVGSAEASGSLTYYESILASLQALPGRLGDLRQKRAAISQSIYEKIGDLADTYRSLYAPVQHFTKLYGLTAENLDLRFEVSIRSTDFEDRFFEWIGRNVAGSFYGPDGGKALSNVLARHSFDSAPEVGEFLTDLMGQLTTDNRTAERVRIVDQLRKGKDLVSFYDFLFSLEYLRPRYVLKLGDKEMSQLSPGERGALLLVFYLLVDRDDIPLIIDQPEENLDNETVYRTLVSAIREAKNRRQIIIVTHNPNLAVVCDAEQVICCSIDRKGGNRISYCSGAIECPEINRRIVDILEGTRPAFDNRANKYEPFRLRNHAPGA